MNKNTLSFGSHGDNVAKMRLKQPFMCGCVHVTDEFLLRITMVLCFWWKVSRETSETKNEFSRAGVLSRIVNLIREQKTICKCLNRNIGLQKKYVILCILLSAIP